MEPNKLRKKLLKYGTLVAAVAGITDGQSAIVYTDEVPDFAGAIGSQYFLDLNNDGTDDFRIWHNGSSNLYVSPLISGNGVLGSGGATYAYPFALSLNAPIAPGGVTFYTNGFAGGFQSLNYGSCSFGNWCTQTDKYLGFEFMIGANTHYGWARLDVDADGSIWAVKDYAYEDVAATGINAGDFQVLVSADSVTNVMGSDIGNNGNGLDLQVDFDAALDETTISEYRIIAVKTDSVGSFDLPAASALAAANYTAMTPTALANYTQVLNAASVDADGDAVATGVPYTIFILSVADGTIATENKMVSSAASVVINTTADLASTLVAADVADNANGTDYLVTFDAATNESSVSEYRLIAVKTSAVGTFDLTAAEALAAPNYTPVVPNGGPYSVNPSNNLDADGDVIGLGMAYSFFVLSIQDSVVANLNDLSTSSNSETLNTTTMMSSGIVGTDVSDNSGSEDLEVKFDAATSEAGILAYRMFAVTDASSGTFTLANAMALGATAYTDVTPSGGPYNELLNVGQTDSDGLPIVLGQEYNVFIVSMADGTMANMSSMASSAATVTLNSPTSPATNVVGSDIEDFGNGSDAQVTFDAAANETGMEEYRVMLVKEANVATFDVIAAEAVSLGDYASVSPDGSVNYSKIFTVSGTDVDGDSIAEDVSYQAVVLSVGDGTLANVSSLSAASDTFTLKSEPATGIRNNVSLEASAFVNGSNNIVIELDANVISLEVQASLYNLLGKNILSQKLNKAYTEFNTNKFVSGVYLLVLENKKGASQTIKLMLK